MRIVAGLFGFGTKETPKRYHATKDKVTGKYVARDSVTGFQRPFPDKDTADVFVSQQNKMNEMQGKLDTGGGPSLKKGLKEVGLATAKVAVPLAVGGAVHYGWRRLNKKAGLTGVPGAN